MADFEMCENLQYLADHFAMEPREWRLLQNPVQIRALQLGLDSRLLVHGEYWTLRSKDMYGLRLYGFRGGVILVRPVPLRTVVVTVWASYLPELSVVRRPVCLLGIFWGR